MVWRVTVFFRGCGVPRLSSARVAITITKSQLPE